MTGGVIPLQQTRQVGHERQPAGTVIREDPAHKEIPSLLRLVGTQIEDGQIPVDRAEQLKGGRTAEKRCGEGPPIGQCDGIPPPRPGRRGRRRPTLDDRVMGEEPILGLPRVPEKSHDELLIGKSEQLRDRLRRTSGSRNGVHRTGTRRGHAVPPPPNLLTRHPETDRIDATLRKHRVHDHPVLLPVQGAPHPGRQRAPVPRARRPRRRGAQADTVVGDRSGERAPASGTDPLKALTCKPVLRSPSTAQPEQVRPTQLTPGDRLGVDQRGGLGTAEPGHRQSGTVRASAKPSASATAAS